MRRSLLLLFLIVSKISLSQIWYPKPKTLTDFDLKGPVKEMIYIDNCQEVQSGMYSNRGCHSVSQFNHAGYLTQSYSKSFIGAFTDTSLYFISEDSVIVKTYITNSYIGKLCNFKYNYKKDFVEIECYSQSELDEKITWIYDTLTNTQLTSFFYNGEKGLRVYAKTLKKFDSNGNLISLGKLGKKDVPFEVTSYVYNNQNRVISKCIWKQQPKKKSEYSIEPEYHWTNYEYDPSGNLIKQEEFIDLDKKPLTRETLVYNESDLLVEKKDTNFIRAYSYTTTFEYDSLNRIKLISNFIGGGFCSYIAFAYDDKNNLILEVTNERSQDLESKESQPKYVWKETQRISYEYDHHNNWIKKYYFDYDGTEKVVTREITYYE